MERKGEAYGTSICRNEEHHAAARGGTEQQSEFVCVNGRTFQVPRGKAVEVPEPVYEVLENARRQLEAAQRIEDAMAAG